MTFLGDDNAVREELAAVYNAVTYCVDLAHRGDDTLFRIEQNVDNRLDRFLVGGHCDVKLELLIGLVAGVGQHTVDADALAQALGQQDTRSRGLSSWYFREELPALMTRMFMFFTSPLFLLLGNPCGGSANEIK